MVMQILPELHTMCGVHSSPLSMVHPDSLMTSSMVMPLLTPPPTDSTHALVFVEHGGLGVVVFHSPEPIGQVVPASDEVVASNALAPVSEAL